MADMDGALREDMPLPPRIGTTQVHQVMSSHAIPMTRNADHPHPMQPHLSLRTRPPALPHGVVHPPGVLMDPPAHLMGTMGDTGALHLLHPELSSESGAHAGSGRTAHSPTSRMRKAATMLHGQASPVTQASSASSGLSGRLVSPLGA